MPIEFELVPPSFTQTDLTLTAAPQLPDAQEIADILAADERIRRSPFVDYHRSLTPEGGVLIAYKDIDRSLGYLILRFFTWIVATGVGGWLIFFESPLSWLACFAWFPVLMVTNLLIVLKKLVVHHTVEIMTPET